jgi:dTDP-4-amino-4,6-dideoxygalactose transaminase
MGARSALAGRETLAVAPPALAVARPQLPTADRLLPYLQAIDANGWYANFGPLTLALERRLAERLRGPARVVSTCNGTAALTLALQAAAPAGGLCALPSWTFAATAHAAVRAGLTPWFVDVADDSWMLCPDHLSAVLEQAPGPVAAVVPVAAFGRVPDLDAWAVWRARTGMPVVVDAAAAYDALVCTPVPAAVSLHATKVLGVGEGGYLASEDQDFLDRVRQLSAFGFRGTRVAQFSAGNAKMSEYSAAVGLAALDDWPATRLRFMRAAQQLRIALLNEPRVQFQPGWGAEWISSVCVLRLPDGRAAAVAEALEAQGVGTRRWWGLGCHAMPAFAHAPRTALPVTERLAEATLGVPFAANLEAQEVERIAAALSTALSEP